MKRALSIVIAAAVLMPVFCFSAFADVNTETLIKLYNRKRDMQSKYDIMREIVEKNDSGTIPFLIEALDDLNQYGGLKEKKREEVRQELMIITVREIGDLKAGDAAPVLARTVRDAKNPVLKSEAIYSLGKIGDRSRAGMIAETLKNLNIYRGDDTRSEEVVAYGCIKALELLREPVGYLPVFHAISAGYSRRVRDAAETALKGMVDDPSDIIIGLVENEPNIRMKIEGLKAADYSQASHEKKLAVAAASLRMGLIMEPANQEEESQLRDLRVTALQMSIRLGYSDGEAIRIIEQLFYIRTDDSEKLLAVESLKGMRSDEAVLALTRFLDWQNDRQESGVTDKDNKIIIETIRALGFLGNRLAFEELMRVKFSGYTASVTREADQALQNLRMQTIIK